MISPETDVVSYVGQNLLLVGIIGLLIFVFFVMLTRKRWKANFLHPPDSHGSDKKDDDGGEMR
jgi:hypothetical protein